MIVVVANYRTGSSTLIRKLYKETGLRPYKKFTGEWCHNADMGYRPPHPGIQLYKIMPDNVCQQDNIERFKREYLKCADRLIFNVRKNVREQVNSALYSSVTKFWHPGDKLPVTKTVLTNVNSINHVVNLITVNLKLQRMWYREFGGELMFLEDREDKQKYDKPDMVDIAPYELEIEDAEKYFNE